MAEELHDGKTWDEMSSHEKNALVAHKVLGYSFVDEGVVRDEDGMVVVFGDDEREEDVVSYLARLSEEGIPYNSDYIGTWNGMKIIVKKVEEQGYAFTLNSPAAFPDAETMTSEKWNATFLKPTPTEIDGEVINIPKIETLEGDTAPEATCLAALRANGVDI